MSQAPTVRNERPQAVRQQTLNASLEISQSPWPPPDLIERYEEKLPGSAERLIRLVEQEAEHRRALESKQLRSEIIETHVGQWMAFIVALFTIGIGAYAALHGAEWTGSIIGSGGVIGLTTVFIYGRRRN